MGEEASSDPFLLLIREGGKELTQMFFSARLQGINICESGMARAPVTECYGCLCHFFHKGIVSFEKKRFALDRIPAERKMSFT